MGYHRMDSVFVNNATASVYIYISLKDVKIAKYDL